MATKTISVDLVAYARLESARRHPKESFSNVIRRAEWSPTGTRGVDLLAMLEDLPHVESEILESLETDQKRDQPPIDKWR